MACRRDDVGQSLGRLNVDIIDRAKLVRINGNRATLKGVFEERRSPIEGIDAVVSPLGAISHALLFNDPKTAGAVVHCISDAKPPRHVTAAERDAAETVWGLDAVDKPDPFSMSAALAAGNVQ